MLNRPIAPHLTIFKPQISSMYSIWHRISGIFLILCLFIFLFSIKTILIINLQNLYFSWNFSYNELKFILITISLFFVYHFLNGIRHIIWDLNFYVNLNFLKKSSLIMSFFIIFLLVKSIF